MESGPAFPRAFPRLPSGSPLLLPPQTLLEFLLRGPGVSHQASCSCSRIAHLWESADGQSSSTLGQAGHRRGQHRSPEGVKEHALEEGNTGPNLVRVRVLQGEGFPG